MKHNLLAIIFVITFASITTAQKSVMDSLYSLAYDKTSEGNVPDATALLVRVEKLAEAAKDTAMLCRVQLFYSKLALISENDQAAEKGIALAQKFCHACENIDGLSRLYVQKGVLEIKQNKHDEAMESLKKAPIIT
ncbi:MAG: hypothetical protein IPL65_03725 [Lewinellaceae bacterium]|nr:hypothetical protein [Lewinellaceae bacterium]